MSSLAGLIGEGSRTASTLGALGAIPWLAAVPDKTLIRLAGQSVLHRAPAGVHLFEQAEVPAFAQILLAGAVDLLAVRGTTEVLVELVRPPDMLLPAAVLSGQPCLVAGRVQEEAHLLLIHAEVFRRAVATDMALCLAVLACQAAQFRRQMKLAKSVRLRSAEERVGSYLVSLCEANGEARETPLPLEKRLIAGQLGMTRETFSRALPVMARHGLRVVGDVLVVEDLAAARAVFPHDALIDGPEPIRPLAPTRI